MVDINKDCLWAKTVLDHGFVRVIDKMGDDAAVVQACRVSYGKGTKTPSDDASLIDYTLRHKHTSPFEQCEIKFHIKLPMFVNNQWIRHRTAQVVDGEDISVTSVMMNLQASKNEYSGRYSKMCDEMYEPDLHRMTRQHKTNKQGSGEDTVENIMDCYRDIITANAFARESYNDLLSVGLNRETARTVLNLNQYTEKYWKIDLHNLLHFLQLRMDSHAQWEIQQYANVIAEYVKQWCPMVWAAFEEHRLYGTSFSCTELQMIRSGNYDKPESMSDNKYREFKVKMGIL